MSGNRTAPDIAPARFGAADVGETARLRLALTRLHRQLRRNSALDLTPSQISALTRLEECGPVRLGSLASAEGISAPSASRLVEVLVSRRLVERVGDPVDARATLIGLSPHGRELLNELRARSTRALRTALETLDARQRAVLHEAVPALEALIDALQQRTGPPEQPAGG